MRLWESYDALLHRTEGAPTVVCENFSRTLPDFSPKELVSVTAHPLPAWGGEVKLWLRFAGLSRGGVFLRGPRRDARAAEALARDLSNAGLTAAATKGDPMPTAGAVAVLTGHLSAGTDYPFAKFAIITSRRQKVEERRPAARRARAFRVWRAQTRGLCRTPESRYRNLYLDRAAGSAGSGQDYIKIQYAGADTLFVPVTQLI